MKMLMTAALLAAQIVTGQTVRAEEGKALSLYFDAYDKYNERNLTKLDATTEVVSMLDEAITEAESNSTKYDIYVLKSRALYWNGKHLTKGSDTDTKEARKAVFLAAKDVALQAVKIGKSDSSLDNAEGYYFAGINLARWAEQNGVLASLGQKEELKEYMDKASERVTRDGEKGEAIDGFGPDRVLAKMYNEIPDFLFPAYGDDKEGLKHAKRSYELAPTVALNTVYYAELLGKNKNTKQTAIDILNALLANDPNTLNEDRIPENTEEFAEARSLLKDLQ